MVRLAAAQPTNSAEPNSYLCKKKKRKENEKSVQKSVMIKYNWTEGDWNQMLFNARNTNSEKISESIQLNLARWLNRLYFGKEVETKKDV